MHPYAPFVISWVWLVPQPGGSVCVEWKTIFFCSPSNCSVSKVHSPGKLGAKESGTRTLPILAKDIKGAKSIPEMALSARWLQRMIDHVPCKSFVSSLDLFALLLHANFHSCCPLKLPQLHACYAQCSLVNHQESSWSLVNLYANECYG